MIAKRHSGVVEKGRFRPDDPTSFKYAFCSMDKKRVCVTVTPERKARSNNQNSYLWGVVYALLSEHTGHTPEELHDFFKSKYIRVPGKNGITWVTRSTASLNTAEMECYLKNLRDFASAELGLYIPEPNECEWGK